MNRVLVIAMLCEAGCGRIGFGLFGDSPGDAATDTTTDGKQVPPPPVSQADCPPGYTFNVASCYRYDETDIVGGWLRAEQICEAEGAHLVVVNDFDEGDHVDGITDPLELDHWYGGSDLVTQGTFVTVTGETQFSMFKAGEPSLGDHCLTLRDDRQLDATDCMDDNSYICELDGLPGGNY